MYSCIVPGVMLLQVFLCSRLSEGAIYFFLVWFGCMLLFYRTYNILRCADVLKYGSDSYNTVLKESFIL